MGYSIVNVDEIEGAGPGGAVRFVRRELGVEAFGDQLVRAARRTRRDASTTRPGRARKRSTSSSAARGVYRIDGEEVPVRGAGTFLRFDPETTRGSRSPGRTG